MDSNGVLTKREAIQEKIKAQGEVVRKLKSLPEQTDELKVQVKQIISL